MNGKRIRDLRILRGHTQESLAEILGSDSRQVWRWENDKTRPSVDAITKLAVILETSTDYLLGLTENPNKPDENLKPDERTLLNALRLGETLRAIKMIVSMNNHHTN